MFELIKSFLGWILSPIIDLLNFPALPAGVVDILNKGIEYMGAGMGIFNFFCPLSGIKPVVIAFLAVWGIEHGYHMLMWVLHKIPFLGIK